MNRVPHNNSSLTHHVTVRVKSVRESAAVNPNDAAVLKYTHVKGLSAREVALILNTSPGAIYVRLHRLRKKFPGLAEL